MQDHGVVISLSQTSIKVESILIEYFFRHAKISHESEYSYGRAVITDSIEKCFRLRFTFGRSIRLFDSMIGIQLLYIGLTVESNRGITKADIKNCVKNNERM